MLLAVRGKAGREGHAGKIADRLALPGFEIEQRHLGIADAERHIGDLLRGRRKARGDDELLAAVEVFDVGAVHVHHGQPLAPLLLRAALVDEDDAGIEKSLLAGDAREHGVGDHVRDAARVRGVGRVLLAGDLLAGRGVPQPELRRDAPAVLTQHPSGQDELRVGRLPGVHVGRRVRIGDRFGKARRIDRQKEDRAGEIRGDDSADFFARIFAGERRHRDGHRFEIGARMDIDVARGVRGRAGERDEAEREGR